MFAALITGIPVVHFGQPSFFGTTNDHAKFSHDGLTLRDVFEAVPGTDGDVRVLWRPTGTSDWADTNWTAVDGLRDFTAQLPLENLKSNTAYEVKVESRSVSGDLGQSLSGGFRTAPSKDEPARVVFTVSTGQDHRCPVRCHLPNTD